MRNSLLILSAAEPDIAEDTVAVYAVFHTSQDPQKWRDRLP